MGIFIVLKVSVDVKVLVFVLYEDKSIDKELIFGFVE